jgi:hypothetical protein
VQDIFIGTAKYFSPEKNLHRQFAFCIIVIRGGRPRVSSIHGSILVKVFATALALSLVMTRPDAVKTQFDPATDKAEVWPCSAPAATP